jgi:hypothetical protein
MHQVQTFCVARSTFDHLVGNGEHGQCARDRLQRYGGKLPSDFLSNTSVVRSVVRPTAAKAVAGTEPLVHTAAEN